MLRLASRLRPIFTMRFERKRALLALGHGVRAEACIDRGTIEAGRAREPLLELELELLEGELGPLIGLGETLVARQGLRIERASKAERGYRLAGTARPEPPAKWRRPAIAEEAAASDALVLLCGAALEQIAANAPGVARGEDPEYLHQLRVGIRRLMSAVRAFRPLLRRKRADAVTRQRFRGVGEHIDDWMMFFPEKETDSGIAPQHHQAASQFRLKNDEQSHHYGREQVVKHHPKNGQVEAGDDHLGGEKQAEHY